MNIVDIALKIRQEVLKMAMHAHGGHIAPAFSMADIVTVLYFDNVLKYNPQNPNWEDRDFFILSKGHGVLSLYVALAMTFFFSMEELKNFCKPGSKLGSLARSESVPGIEASTGSLGHGLSYAVGIALACKLDNKDNQVYVVVGDGECQEGSIWEGLMAASHHQLDNMVVIIDYNGLQAMDSIKNIMSIDGFTKKLQSFGFSVDDIDGHNYSDIKKALQKREKYKPRAVIAHTVKGKGISFMENVPIWHYRIPDERELEIALKDLNMTREDLGQYENSLFRNVI